MNKKIIIIVLLAIFLMATISSTSVVAKSSSEDAGLVLVSSEISIELDPQTDINITALDTKTIDITVKYRLDMDDLTARLFFNRRIGRFLLFGFGHILKSKGEPSAKIELSVESPDWCTVSIDSSNVTTEISNVFKEAEPVQLTISVNESAPALEPGDIVITAESKAVWGIGGATNKTTIPVMVDYMPLISIRTEYNYKEIPPLNITNIQFNITNLGNDKTAVSIEVENASKFDISYVEEIILGSLAKGQDNKGTVVVSVRPYKNLTRESLQISFTPHYYGDRELKGQTIIETIVLKNDGSLKDENGIPGLEIIIILSIAIVAIVIIALFLKRKKD